MKLFLKTILSFLASLVSTDGPLQRLMQSLARCFAGLLMVAISVFPALGQGTRAGAEKTQTGSVHGTISTTQENAGSGLSGLSVKLTTVPPDGNTLSADTDDAGHYEFKNLKPGSYTISITQPGFKPVTKTV